MRIAIIASIWISVPPKDFGFGAQEYLAYSIAEGLKKKGHDVSLFASGDSKVTTRLVSISKQQVKDIDFPDTKIKDVFELINLSEAYKNNHQFDIIHNHLLPYGLLFAPLTKTPTVHTLHHKIYPTRADFFLYKQYVSQNFISISQSQRLIMPQLNYISTVYNGIDTSFYKFKDKPSSNYLLYLGRMKQYKGIHTAIHLAKKLHIPLKIAAPLPFKTQSDYEEVMNYWETKIKPNIANNIEYIDAISGSEKTILLQNAKALIFPVEREEPFGMTIIEAMACGTPVIAYDMGATQELLIDKKTGYLVNYRHYKSSLGLLIKKKDSSGLEEAIKHLYSLNQKDYEIMRSNSRKHVEKNFTVEKMVNQYEKIYLNFTIPKR